MRRRPPPTVVELHLACPCGQRRTVELSGVAEEPVTCATCGTELLAAGSAILEVKEQLACRICSGVIRAGLPHLRSDGTVMHVSCLKTSVVPLLKEGQKRSTSMPKKRLPTVSGGLPSLGKR